MSRLVTDISKRMSLRDPLRASVEALERVVGSFRLSRELELPQVLALAQKETPTFTDFERTFPSYTFALATGVGKTRLMGAFIAWLHLTGRSSNFFVLAPNLTIYNKLLEDFTPNTPKYVFTGLADFVTSPPVLITGENYESGIGMRRGQLRLGEAVRDDAPHINIFNIGKISEKATGTKMLRIRQLSEYIGESYFDYLRGLPDLVLLMDESHRYRASAGLATLNELRPVLGLELTATPFVQAGTKVQLFKNVLYEFSLKQAMEAGFVKEPACTRRENVDTSKLAPAELEQMKIDDGLTIHETTCINLDMYAKENGVKRVKPFVLIVARGSEHAAELRTRLDNPTYRDGRYVGKVIVIESKPTKEADELEFGARLAKVQSADEPTEIVIHIQMLKEGWDVNNLYTIIPLNAANSRQLIEQTLGRGLRLPYGKRVGDKRADQLVIVAHEKYNDLIEDAKKGDSPFQMASIILGPNGPEKAPTPVPVPSTTQTILGFAPPPPPGAGPAPAANRPLITPEGAQPAAARKAAETALGKMISAPARFAPSSSSAPGVAPAAAAADLTKRLTAAVVEDLAGSDVATLITPAQIAEVVAQVIEAVGQHTIEVPRIMIQPSEDAHFELTPFKMDVAGIDWQPVDQVLLIHELRDGSTESLGLDVDVAPEQRLEDYIIRGLIDDPALDYGNHADTLYGLAGEILAHLQTYLTADQCRLVILQRQRDFARLIRTQFLAHGKMVASSYQHTAAPGCVGLAPTNVLLRHGDSVLDFREAPKPLGSIKGRVFGGFGKCLLTYAKFDSDGERRLAEMLETGDGTVTRWVKPSPNSFAIHLRDGGRYDPDFVIETNDARYLVEVKAPSEIPTKEVQEKAEAAFLWCQEASRHTSDKKPWRYILTPDTFIQHGVNMHGLWNAHGKRTAK